MARHALPAYGRLHVHALDLAIVRAQHHGGAATRHTGSVTRYGKAHVRLGQRGDVQRIAGLGRVQATLVGIQLGDEGDDVGLARVFEGDVHGGSGGQKLGRKEKWQGFHPAMPLRYWQALTGCFQLAYPFEQAHGRGHGHI